MVDLNSLDGKLGNSVHANFESDSDKVEGS